MFYNFVRVTGSGASSYILVKLHLVRDWGWFPCQSPRVCGRHGSVAGEVIMCGHCCD